MAMMPMEQGVMEAADYYGHLDRNGTRPARRPTIAVNGHVYGSRNHPSSFVRSMNDPNGPQNLKGIFQTMDKARANQEMLRRRKQKYEAFVVEPMMGRHVIETPGIGAKEAKLLQRHRIGRSTGLREVFLDLGKKGFIEWMCDMGINEANATECSQALHDWCANYIKLPR
ncbi:uncharacterized protein LOC105442460 [Strongylocentrotus purpuratus]|uniref:Uncharacterized protein n=1 Tax=Strongylocentrotus purpuratus TaxID=7668 RepID=A0A7M7HG24_STRPU|nr:uncharacterized protein LOC105442460 [Strongylocentrotus purpuratus]